MKIGVWSGMAAAILWSVMAGAVLAGDVALREVHDVRSEAEAKLQTQVLDALLGPGKAYIFLEASVELKASAEKMSKTGLGKMHKSRAGAEGEDGKEDKDASAEQMSSQEKKSSEGKRVFRLELAGMKLRILHDAALPAVKLKAVKEALLALYQETLKPGDISFVPAAFEAAPGCAPAD